jgi:hypothetical protein
MVVKLNSDNERLTPLQEEDTKNKLLWRIVFDPKFSDRISATIERIEYGKVPEGFTQETPAQGAAERLEENQIYEARGPLSLMSNAVIRFKIVKGKTVMLPIPQG